MPATNENVKFLREVNPIFAETIVRLRYRGKECSLTIPGTTNKLPEGLTGTAVRESHRTGSRKIELGGGLYLIHNGWKSVR